MNTWQYLYKILLVSVVVIAVAEVSKKTAFWGAAIASLPILSISAFTVLYIDTADPERVAMLSQNVFWLILPSLTFFLLLPIVLRLGVNYWISLPCVLAVTLVAYLVAISIYKKVGIHVGH